MVTRFYNLRDHFLFSSKKKFRLEKQKIFVTINGVFARVKATATNWYIA